MPQYKSKIVTHNFTLKAPGLTRMLAMDIELTPIDNPVKKIKTKGIWDTGATSTITQEIFDHLGLTQNGITRVSTASVSNQTQPTYLIDVFLKQDLRIQGVEVTVGKIASESGFHCLIGMDIITLGDFTITNHNSETWLSFRVPSMKSVDYVDQFQKEAAIVDKHFKARGTMNSPCACGSNRKFKNCHGKDLIEV